MEGTDGQHTPARPEPGDEQVPEGPLHVLIIEDEPSDADLMVRALRRGGLDAHCEVVDSEAAFRVALRARPDVVLADYAVPGFGAIPALAIVADKAPDIPLLVVSGAITDETAVATLRAGAADFLLKDRLNRLASAISAAVERHRLERERDRAERRLRSLAANMSDLMFSVRLRPLTVEYVTPSVLQFSGYSEREVRHDPHLCPLFQPEVISAMATTGVRETSYEIRPEKRKVWVEVRGTPLLDERGGVAGFHGVARDVSEARSARELLARRARQSSVVAGLSQDILDGDSFDSVLWRAAEGLARALDVELSEVLVPDTQTADLRLREGTGWEQELLGQIVVGADEPSQERFTLATQAPVVLADAAHETRFEVTRMLAEHGVTSGITTVVRGAGGDPFGVLGAYAVEHPSFTVDDVNFVQTVANVLTSCLQREEVARQRATETMADPVTGLPDRERLLDHLAELLAQAGEERPVLVAAVNVDRYADVRDAFGQATTDRFLATMGRRLRQACGPSDLVAAHEPGHLYAVHLAEPSPQEPNRFGERLLEAFDEPAYLSGQELRTTGSVGLVRMSAAQPDIEDSLRRADLAMRRAVELGGDRVETYEPAEYETGRARLDRTIDIRRGIDSGEIRVVFQPVVDLRTRTVVGAEALARWDHPTVGLLSPSHFLPAADEAGLAPDIGRVVQSRAWAALASWSRSPVLSGLHLAVNASPRELAHPGFAKYLLGGLREAGVQPEQVWLELTEKALTEEAFMPVLRGLQAAGVTLAIDDFGTHYSSLARVRDTRPGLIKIDQSFVARVEHRPSDRSLVDAAVHIAAAVGARTVGEGVETEGQARIVTEAGCDLAQGYFFSPPLSAGDFEEFVVTRDGVTLPAVPTQVTAADVEERR